MLSKQHQPINLPPPSQKKNSNQKTLPLDYNSPILLLKKPLSPRQLEDVLGP